MTQALDRLSKKDKTGKNKAGENILGDMNGKCNAAQRCIKINTNPALLILLRKVRHET